MTVAEIVASMPAALQARFNSLSSFVSTVLDEGGFDDPPPSREEKQFLQLVALIYALDRFFRAGTRAARSAAITFEALHADGFAVGQAVFTHDNQNTMRGERLADALQASITDEELRRAIALAPTMRDLIASVARRSRRASSMG